MVSTGRAPLSARRRSSKSISAVCICGRVIQGWMRSGERTDKRLRLAFNSGPSRPVTSGNVPGRAIASPVSVGRSVRRYTSHRCGSGAGSPRTFPDRLTGSRERRRKRSARASWSNARHISPGFWAVEASTDRVSLPAAHSGAWDGWAHSPVCNHSSGRLKRLSRDSSFSTLSRKSFAGVQRRRAKPWTLHLIARLSLRSQQVFHRLPVWPLQLLAR